MQKSYLHCLKDNANCMLLIDGGKAKRQPFPVADLYTAILKIIQTEESKGQIYELGGSQTYTLKELFEFMGNNLNQRPFYVDYSFDEFMRLYLAPNFSWEKAAHWLIARPDYLVKQRFDNIITKKKGVKTFHDLGITPSAAHSNLTFMTSWLLEKINLEQENKMSYEEINADDDGHSQ